MEMELNFSDFAPYVHYLERSPELLGSFDQFLRAETPNVKRRDEYAKPTLFGIFSLFLNWIQPLFPADFFQVVGLVTVVPQMKAESVRQCARSLGVELPNPAGMEGISLAWEKLLNCIQHPKVSGTYFTPPKIAELMAGLFKLGEKKLIVDPACGTGVLLVPYLHRFPKNLRVQELKNIFGWDINPLNVVITRLNLLLEVIQSLNAEEVLQTWSILRKNITCRDALELAALPRRFDAAILNPPYLRIEMLKQRKETLGEFQLIHRRLDSYLLFLELCLKLINEEGEVVAIVPDKVLTESNGQKLRQKLLEENLLRKVIDCRSQEIFRGIASVHPVILHLQSHSSEEGIETFTISMQDSRSYGLHRQDSLPATLFKMLPSARIDPQLTMERARILEKILAKSFPLKEIAYVSYGAQPGIKDNFVFESSTRPPDNGELKWLLRGRDVKKYQVESPRYVIRYLPEKLHRPAFPQLFLSPRVVVQKVTGQQGLIAGIVPPGQEYYTDDSIINVVTLDNLASIPDAFRKNRGFKFVKGNNESIPVGNHWWREITKSYARGAMIREDLQKFYMKFSPILLCAVLNSQVIAFFYKLLLAGGMNVFPEHVRWLPITPDLISAAPKIMSQLENLRDIDDESLNEILFKAYALDAGEIGTVKRFLENQ